MRKIAISFLTKKANFHTLQFAGKLTSLCDIFVVSDEISDEKSNLIVYVDDSECINSGYVNSNVKGTHINKNPIAIDKALYWFSKKDYDFILFVEDDVFIPSVSAIKSLIDKYSHGDLVVPYNTLKRDNVLDWHWKCIVDKITPPYYSSMICVVGISKNMMRAIDYYVKKNRTLIYVEAMFNTLAHHNNLSVICPKELKSITWQGFWGLNEFSLFPNNLFHPVKEISKHSVYRDFVDNPDNYLECLPCNKEYLFPIPYKNTLIPYFLR